MQSLKSWIRKNAYNSVLSSYPDVDILILPLDKLLSQVLAIFSGKREPYATYTFEARNFIPRPNDPEFRIVVSTFLSNAVSRVRPREVLYLMSPGVASAGRINQMRANAINPELTAGSATMQEFERVVRDWIVRERVRTEDRIVPDRVYFSASSVPGDIIEKMKHFYQNQNTIAQTKGRNYSAIYSNDLDYLRFCLVWSDKINFVLLNDSDYFTTLSTARLIIGGFPKQEELALDVKVLRQILLTRIKRENVELAAENPDEQIMRDFALLLAMVSGGYLPAQLSFEFSDLITFYSRPLIEGRRLTLGFFLLIQQLSNISISRGNKNKEVDPPFSKDRNYDKFAERYQGNFTRYTTGDQIHAVQYYVSGLIWSTLLLDESVNNYFYYPYNKPPLLKFFEELKGYFLKEENQESIELLLEFDSSLPQLLSIHQLLAIVPVHRIDSLSKSQLTILDSYLLDLIPDKGGERIRVNMSRVFQAVRFARSDLTLYLPGSILIYGPTNAVNTQPLIIRSERLTVSSDPDPVADRFVNDFDDVEVTESRGRGTGEFRGRGGRGDRGRGRGGRGTGEFRGTRGRGTGEFRGRGSRGTRGGTRGRGDRGRGGTSSPWSFKSESSTPTYKRPSRRPEA